MTKRVMIAGPTASGKTSLAINLAEQMNAEIISVDSRQCYKHIDIGTAKPTLQQLSRVKHHNISVLDLTREDSVAAFLDRIKTYETEIIKKEKNIIYCGGSTLHLQSIIRPLDDIPKTDPVNFDKLNREATEKGLGKLYQKLNSVDPDYAQRMDGMNRQRIIRALDVWMQTGKPFSSFHQNKKIVIPENLEVFILNHPRKELHQRINERTNMMVKQGLVQETEEIIRQGYKPELQSLQTVGYREVISFLKGDMIMDGVVKNIKTSTRRYAKRQITWFRRWPSVAWIDMNSKTNKEIVKEILNKGKILQ